MIDKKRKHDNIEVESEKSKEAVSKEASMGNIDLKTRTGGAYIPPAKLRMMQEQITDKSSEAYQRLSWEALKKSINGLVNKINVSNIGNIIRELIQENIIRGRGLLSQSIMRAQAASPTFTNVYAALVAVINSKFPENGQLILRRVIVQFQRCFKRKDKSGCVVNAQFIAHLVNQQVAHEIIALELCTLLLSKPTNDSAEVCIGFLKECGQKLEEVTPRGIKAIYDELRKVLHEGTIDKRVEYMIEVMFQIRKDQYKDHQMIVEGLDLIEEEDQYTHLLHLDDSPETEQMLNIFKFDPNFLENEAKFKEISDELLQSGDEESSDESDEDEEEDEEEEEAGTVIFDQTEAGLLQFRKTVYLTIQSSLSADEAAHKLLKVDIKPGLETELCNMILDCCAQQRTYEKFYGLLGERFCKLDQRFEEPMETIFKEQYDAIHHLETMKLRNVGNFFAHLLYSDSISWGVLKCIKITEEDTTSSGRIFLKILFQALDEHMGLADLIARFKDPTLQEFFEGIFPTDTAKNTRFGINFFTSIGLGALTDELRETLKEMNAQKALAPMLEAIQNAGNDDSSGSSSDEENNGKDKKRGRRAVIEAVDILGPSQPRRSPSTEKTVLDRLKNEVSENFRHHGSKKRRHEKRKEKRRTGDRGRRDRSDSTQRVPVKHELKSEPGSSDDDGARDRLAKRRGAIDYGRADRRNERESPQRSRRERNSPPRRQDRDGRSPDRRQGSPSTRGRAREASPQRREKSDSPHRRQGQRDGRRDARDSPDRRQSPPARGRDREESPRRREKSDSPHRRQDQRDGRRDARDSPDRRRESPPARGRDREESPRRKERKDSPHRRQDQRDDRSPERKRQSPPPRSGRGREDQREDRRKSPQRSRRVDSPKRAERRRRESSDSPDTKRESLPSRPVREWDMGKPGPSDSPRRQDQGDARRQRDLPPRRMERESPKPGPRTSNESGSRKEPSNKRESPRRRDQRESKRQDERERRDSPPRIERESRHHKASKEDESRSPPRIDRERRRDERKRESPPPLERQPTRDRRDSTRKDDRSPPHIERESRRRRSDSSGEKKSPPRIDKESRRQDERDSRRRPRESPPQIDRDSRRRRSPEFKVEVKQELKSSSEAESSSEDDRKHTTSKGDQGSRHRRVSSPVVVRGSGKALCARPEFNRKRSPSTDVVDKAAIKKLIAEGSKENSLEKQDKRKKDARTEERRPRKKKESSSEESSSSESEEEPPRRQKNERKKKKETSSSESESSSEEEDKKKRKKKKESSSSDSSSDDSSSDENTKKKRFEEARERRRKADRILKDKRKNESSSEEESSEEEKKKPAKPQRSTEAKRDREPQRSSHRRPRSRSREREKRRSPSRERRRR